MGLPRRTKIEQIRERDLMMPQEVRQMPESRMILLTEGQRPIFGEKLRFFQTQPFKSAGAFSQANIPQVPDVEYLPPKPIPATTPEYAKDSGDLSVETPSPAPVRERNRLAASWAESAVVDQEPGAEEKSAAPAKRTVNKKALRPKPKATTAKAGHAKASLSLDLMDARIKAIEEGLEPKAAQIKEVVETKVEKLGDKSPAKRRNYMDIFRTTIPDPVDVGLAAE